MHRWDVRRGCLCKAHPSSEQLVKRVVCVVAVQNAGKSSLINAMRQAVGLGSGRNITTAALPGTTLGAGSAPCRPPAEL